MEVTVAAAGMEQPLEIAERAQEAVLEPVVVLEQEEAQEPVVVLEREEAQAPAAEAVVRAAAMEPAVVMAAAQDREQAIPRRITSSRMSAMREAA